MDPLTSPTPLTPVMNLKEIDLNLMAVFEAFYEERHQGKAAERLGLTQPAISLALSRLRQTLNDPLFEGRMLAATPKARALFDSLHAGLDHIRRAISEVHDFDPVHSHRPFCLAITYSGGLMRVPSLYQRIAQEAPNVHLSVRAIDPPEQLRELLCQQQIDAAITHVPPSDSCLASTQLPDRELVALVRQGHPLLESALDMESLQQESFATLFGYLDGLIDSRHAGLQRLLQTNIRLEAPAAVTLFIALATTDLVAIVTRELAELGAQRFGLQCLNLPEAIPAIPLYLVWHRNLEWDKGQRWLRAHVLDLW